MNTRPGMNHAFVTRCCTCLGSSRSRFPYIRASPGHRSARCDRACGRVSKVDVPHTGPKNRYNPATRRRYPSVRDLRDLISSDS